MVAAPAQRPLKRARSAQRDDLSLATDVCAALREPVSTTELISRQLTGLKALHAAYKAEHAALLTQLQALYQCLPHSTPNTPNSPSLPRAPLSPDIHALVQQRAAAQAAAQLLSSPHPCAAHLGPRLQLTEAHAGRPSADSPPVKDATDASTQLQATGRHTSSTPCTPEPTGHLSGGLANGTALPASAATTISQPHGAHIALGAAAGAGVAQPNTAQVPVVTDAAAGTTALGSATVPAQQPQGEQQQEASPAVPQLAGPTATATNNIHIANTSSSSSSVTFAEADAALRWWHVQQAAAAQQSREGPQGAGGAPTSSDPLPPGTSQGPLQGTTQHSTGADPAASTPSPPAAAVGGASPAAVLPAVREPGARFGPEGVVAVQQLEALASAITEQELDAEDAVACLVGCSGRHLLKRTTVLLGRGTGSAGTIDVDVDLSKERVSTKVSRRQAYLTLRPNGTWVVANTGRMPLVVDGVKLLQHDVAQLPHLGTLEVEGVQMLFMVNLGAVARVLRRTQRANI